MDEDTPQVNDENDTPVIQTQVNGTSDDSALLKGNVKSIAQRFEQNSRQLDKKSPVKDLDLSNRNTLFPKETKEGNKNVENEKEEDEKEEDTKEEDTKEDDMFTAEEDRIANFTKETEKENEKHEDKKGNLITAEEAGYVLDETGDLITAVEADNVLDEPVDLITAKEVGLSSRIANSTKDSKEENEKEDNEKGDLITAEEVGFAFDETVDLITAKEAGLSSRIANSTKDTNEENEKEDNERGDLITAEEAGFAFDKTVDLITAKEAGLSRRNANSSKDTKEENEKGDNEKGDLITAEEVGFVFDETVDLITAKEAGLSRRNANSSKDMKEENEKEGDIYTAKKEETPDRNASLTNFKDTNEENKQEDEKSDLIYKFFKKADTQNLGFLTVSQFATAVRKQGFSGKDSEITTMFLDLDANRDCEVTLEEYLNEMGKRDFRFLTEADWLDIFRKFDRNKDGYVTREELQTTLEERNMRQLEIDMDEVMKKADKDGDGKLSFDDFIKSCGLKSH